MTNGTGRARRAGIGLLLLTTVVAAPADAQAGRRQERRVLRAAQPLAAGPVAAAAPRDERVEAGVERLRGAVEGGPVRAATGRRPADQVHIGRSAAGFVTALVAPEGRAWSIARPGTDRSVEGLALSFLREHRAALGLSKAGTSLRADASRRGSRRTAVRLSQSLGGVPVFGAGVVVQVSENGAVDFVLSDVARDDSSVHDPGFSVRPDVAAEAAAASAVASVPAGRGTGPAADAPVLMVFEPSVIGSAGPGRLVWHVRVRDASGDVNDVVLVDAHTGEIAFRYSDVKHARNRQVYDSANVPGSLGSLVRAEGQPPAGLADADLAYQYLGDTYDFYFTRFGRDSFDGAGAALVGRVRYCEPAYSCPFPNAYWNGAEMRFGQGFAGADDVVAHELTHAVTERESNLIYWGESGAINEALSDIFGEFVDLSNTGGNDDPSVRWLIGEDLPGGALRSMADPTLYYDPDRRFSPNWYTGSDDNRGVHYNSGVANKLAFLLTDGGSFNGHTVAAQGIPAVAGLFYEAQVSLLVPASDYFDLYVALRQAARNLGWASASRDALESASRAVQIQVPGNAATVFADGFEGTFPGSWQVFVGDSWPTPSGAVWGRSTTRAAGGAASLYCAGGGIGPVPGPPPSYRPLMDTWIVYGPIDLSSTSQAWAEFDLFMDVDIFGPDDVFWGIAVPDAVGDLWFDGYIVAPGPDGYTTGVEGVPGWGHEVFDFREFPGYVGQSQVWFAFNFQSDSIEEYEGVYVDNFSIRKAATAAPFGAFDYPADGSTGQTGSFPLAGWALDDLKVTKVELYRDPVSGDTQVPGPNGKILLGEATLVPGARPDIETAYPGYPYVEKAGWIRSVLWSSLPLDGNRMFTFHAYAYDEDGRSTLLGTRTLGVASQSPAARRDFEANGRSDVLWRKNTGDLVLWSMDGFTVESTAYVPPVPTTWKVRGLADFDGDGQTDVLWREETSGVTYIWFMSGGNVVSQGLTSSAADTTWTIQGTGDFDGDGKADVLWRNTAGALYVWLMDGTIVRADSAFFPPIGLTWQIAGIGDFNGNGKSDVLWRESGSGTTYIWFMNGAVRVGGGYTEWRADPTWTIQGIGDLGGDGRSDIVWRHTSGALYVWEMNGASFASSAYLPPISLAWTIHQISDLDGDGKADILWRESTTGDSYVWLMNGAAGKAVGYTSAQTNLEWAIQPEATSP